jgi:calcineurin-like phosphoesterase
MIKILFIGDINGKIGRKALLKILPKLKKENNIDLVIANIENSAHGSGITETTINEIQASGVDWMTTGDHAFSRTGQLDIYNRFPVIRPANFSPQSPGKGYALIPIKNQQILIELHLIWIWYHLNSLCADDNK